MKDIPIRKINASETEQHFSESFSIRSVQELLNGKDISQELHRHDFFYILALEKGAGNHEIDFTTYEVGDYSLFFMRPGQVHQHTLKAVSTGFLLEFKTDFYNPQDKASNHHLRKASGKNFYQVDADKFKKLFSLLTYVFLEYTEKQKGYQEVIKANLGVLFIELIRQRDSSTIHTKSTNPYLQERLEDFFELLENNVTTEKQVSQYAEMLNLSLHQLNTITKTLLNKTGSEIINEYIILESKRYLLATSNQVNQIAYHLGYEDTSYFIRFFKKHTGYSPEAYRHNLK
ncbi:MAG: AraC family transcriptional regulator [Flavobacterium sp.]|uniref:AraC family transcriptional regulator n=1 Tax=Flavobacterium sp. TaxID=239 RepID=UPI0032633B68